MKLQDAYVAETGVYYGSWDMIGYKMDASTSFEYDGYKGANEKTSITTAKQGAWKAKAKAALNDCIAGKEWGINIAANSATGGSVVYKAAMTDQTNCLALTPNFAAFSSDKSTIENTVE